MYGYLTDDACQQKKEKDTRRYLITPEIKYRDYKNCQEANRLESKLGVIVYKKVTKNF